MGKCLPRGSVNSKVQSVFRKAFAALAVMSVAINAVFAQEPLLRFQHIQPERSFTSGSIVDVTHDRNGFFWFASLYGGFARFDGERFKTYRYDPGQSGGLSSNATTCVYADPVEPFLWVCTPEGLGRLNLETGTLKFFRNDPADPNSLPHDGVYRLLRDSRGTLWVGLENGLGRQDRGSSEFVHYPLDVEDPNPHNSTPTGWVWDIYEDRAGTLWVATTGGGLLRYDYRTGEFHRFRHDPDDPSSLPNDSVRTVFEDSSGVLWVGSDRGVATMTDRSDGTFEHRGLNALLSITEDKQGNLWFSHRSGLSMLRPGEVEYLDLEHDPANATGLGPGPVWQLHIGPQGNLWTPGNQISWLPPAALAATVYEFPEGRVGSAPVLTLDGENLAWVGDVDGLHRLSLTDGTWQHFLPFPDKDGERENWVRGGLFVAPDATHWAASTNALARFQPETGEFTPFELPATVQSITMASDGMIWMGLAFRGLASFDPTAQKLERFPHDPANPESISHDFAYVVFEDSQGSLWVGTQNGLNRFNPGTGAAIRFFTETGNEFSLSNSTIRSGLLDTSGRLWFGTEFGLNQYRPQSNDFVRFTNGSHPGNNVMYSLSEDSEGVLWIGTDSGLSHFDPDTGTFRNFTSFDGVPPTGFNKDLRLGAKGNLYALATNGVIRIDTDVLNSPVAPLALRWTGINRVNEQTGSQEILYPSDSLSLDYRDELTSIGFSAANLRDPGAIEYRYQMSGLQNEWIYPEPDRNTAIFSRMPAGDYRLVVQARRSGGDWLGASLDLPVSVSPPPWQSAWAYAIYAFLLLVSTAVVFHWRTRLLRVRSGILERAVHERTRQLEESEAKVKHQAVELQGLLEFKERSFANVSHEFRTPLTLMLGPIENARAATRNETIRSQLGMASRNGKRVLRLVDQLLELSRLESRQPVVRTPHPVSGVADTVIEAFRSLARERGVQLILVSDEQLWTEVPAYLVERVLMNLVSNALKYTGSDGSVKVTTSRGEQGMALISVEDTGKGIPAGARARVFDRFKRGDDQFSPVPGSGLGLALVKEIAEAYGGGADLDSEVGRGTSVHVRLPAVTPPAGVTVNESPVPSEALGFEVDLLSHVPVDRSSDILNPGLPHLLVIDDDPDMRTYLETVLDPDYSVTSAVDGAQGVDLALENVPDLVICDLMMPRRDGIEVTQTLRSDQRTSHVPIIMLTARNDDRARLEGLREHVDDFLVKPFNEEELLLQVANLLAIRDIIRARYSADLFACRGAKSQLSAVDQRFFDRLEAVLETHYTQSGFSIASMAAELAMSERQIQRKLKALTDQTPARFLRVFRLDRSLKLLNEGLPVGQVALDVGFVSPGHFSSCFRAQFGCTPSEFQDNPDKINDR